MSDAGGMDDAIAVSEDPASWGDLEDWPNPGCLQHWRALYLALGERANAVSWEDDDHWLYLPIDGDAPHTELMTHFAAIVRSICGRFVDWDATVASAGARYAVPVYQPIYYTWDTIRAGADVAQLPEGDCLPLADTDIATWMEHARTVLDRMRYTLPRRKGYLQSVYVKNRRDYICHFDGIAESLTRNMAIGDGQTYPEGRDWFACELNLAKYYRETTTAHDDNHHWFRDWDSALAPLNYARPIKIHVFNDWSHAIGLKGLTTYHGWINPDIPQGGHVHAFSDFGTGCEPGWDDIEVLDPGDAWMGWDADSLEATLPTGYGDPDGPYSEDADNLELLVTCIYLVVTDHCVQDGFNFQPQTTQE